VLFCAGHLWCLSKRTCCGGIYHGIPASAAAAAAAAAVL